MGLSGRKVKQRIAADPRNLAWADDAAKFGSNYLSKFGWDSSKGLGVDGEGRTSHVKVSHKLDMLGIGAAHQKDPDGIAWKQNKEFESVLRRLNEAAASTEDSTSREESEGQDAQTNPDGQNRDDERSKSGKKERKKKRRKEAEGSSEEKKSKKRKTSKEDQTTETEKVAGQSEAVTAPTALPEAPKVNVQRHRAHRARAIASKSISSKSEASIAEILGISRTPSSYPTSGSETPLGKLTSPTDSDAIEQITTSTKNIADYFKEKLLSKPPISTAPPSRVEQDDDVDELDRPRTGLGAARSQPENRGIGLGASKMSFVMSSMFSPATPTIVCDSGTPAPLTDEPPAKKKKRKERMKSVDSATEDDPSPKEGEKETSLVSPVPSQEDGASAKAASSKEERRRRKAERKARKEQKG